MPRKPPQDLNDYEIEIADLKTCVRYWKGRVRQLTLHNNELASRLLAKDSQLCDANQQDAANDAASTETKSEVTHSTSQS